jgi:tetratricopeptide (TPR) repeat protein
MRLTKHIIPLFTMLWLTGSIAYSQQGVQLPRKSPKASISYSVGFTNITINYSAPAAKERTIWGDLVPYGEVWRAGANEATTIEFSTDVKLEGEPLPAGKYAFFLIPTEENWIAIFNSATDQWGAYAYDESKDVLRVEIEPRSSRINEERLNYTIVDQGIDRGYIRIGWENIRLYLRFYNDAVDVAEAKIEEALSSGPEDQKWVVYAQAADFFMETEDGLDKALEMAEKSTSLFNSSWNWWIKAQIHEKKGDFKGAVSSAEKSLEAGVAAEEDGFYNAMKSTIEASRDHWKAQM